jgi:toxin ParE1/3/4
LGIVIFAPKARSDLDSIWLYVAAETPLAADRLIDRIHARCQNLAVHPRLGPARPEIAADARTLVEGDYLILYRVRAEDVDIVRVVHGAREIAGLFDPEP